MYIHKHINQQLYACIYIYIYIYTYRVSSFLRREIPEILLVTMSLGGETTNKNSIESINNKINKDKKQ